MNNGRKKTFLWNVLHGWQYSININFASCLRVTLKIPLKQLKYNLIKYESSIIPFHRVVLLANNLSYVQ